MKLLIEDEKLSFNYNLKDGISNDRIGYLILKREKVIELLEKVIKKNMLLFVITFLYLLKHINNGNIKSKSQEDW